MVLSEKDLRLIKLLKVKGKLASLAAIEPQGRHGILQRTVFFVPGNAKDMNLDGLFEKRISTLSYDMDTTKQTAKIFSVSTEPDARQQNLAKSLFGYAFREMRTQKIKNATLKWNGDKSSWELYRSVGFGLVDKETREMAVNLDSANVHALCVKTGWAQK